MKYPGFQIKSKPSTFWAPFVVLALFFLVAFHGIQHEGKGNTGHQGDVHCQICLHFHASDLSENEAQPQNYPTLDEIPALRRENTPNPSAIVLETHQKRGPPFI